MSLPWFHLHDDMPGHPKSRYLGALLHEPRAWTHVVELWCFASRYRSDGDLSGLTPPEIARAAGWMGDPQTLVEALRKAGFLDGELLHDWAEVNPAHAEQAEVKKGRSKAALRSQRWRENKKQEAPPANAPERDPNASERVANASECDPNASERVVNGTEILDLKIEDRRTEKEENSNSNAFANVSELQTERDERLKDEPERDPERGNYRKDVLALWELYRTIWNPTVGQVPPFQESEVLMPQALAQHDLASIEAAWNAHKKADLAQPAHKRFLTHREKPHLRRLKHLLSEQLLREGLEIATAPPMPSSRPTSSAYEPFEFDPEMLRPLSDYPPPPPRPDFLKTKPP